MMLMLVVFPWAQTPYVYSLECCSENGSCRRYAPGTANKYIVQIRYMYNVAKKAKIPGSEANPAAGIKQFRVEGHERFLSPEETERLRLAVERSDNKQLKYIVALVLMLGCRKRELLDSRFEHFDLERRTWKIPLSKSGAVRHIALSSASIEILKKLPRWDGCPYVVPNPKTLKPFTHLNESWKTATRRAGLKGFRIHDMRHSFASNLVNAGHSLLVVSRALGHANIQQTSRYSHLSDDTLLAAADAAANAMGENWTEGKKSPA
jgi:integrase